MANAFIVGAGLSGATSARCLAEAGWDVVVIDARHTHSGNVHDHLVDLGAGKIRVHTYGPHIFHTNSQRVWSWLSRFTSFDTYQHRVLARLETGDHVPMPVNATTIERVFGISLPNEVDVSRWLDVETAPYRESLPVSALSAVDSRVGRTLAQLLFYSYTRRQWGRHTDRLPPSVTNRIPVRLNRDDRYFTDKWQGLPSNGYTDMVESILRHPNIHLELGSKFSHDDPRFLGADLRVVTSRIDEFFSYKFGRLPYRSIGFHSSRIYPNEMPRAANGSAMWPMPSVTVNYPSPHAHYTRCTDMGRLTGDYPSRGTVLVSELPRECQYEVDVPSYPVPTEAAIRLLSMYEAEAGRLHSTLFLGRLGRHQYLNMDQAVGSALVAMDRITRNV